MPIYSQIARRSNIEGRVAVEVEIDKEGNVTSAKAVSGHQMLGTRLRTPRERRVSPFELDGTPVKAKGTINYNFSLKARVTGRRVKRSSVRASRFLFSAISA